MRSKVWPFVLLLGFGGGVLFVALVVKHGAADIGQAMGTAGWGLVAVIAAHMIPLLFDVAGWRAVIPAENRLPFRKLLAIRWMGDSVSSMLPVAQVGGEVVRVRLAAAWGMPFPVAAATVLVGMTVSVATQIVFTLSGLFVLSFQSQSHGFFWPTLAGSLIGLLAVGGFYLVQRIGIFRMIGAMISHIAGSPAWKDLAQRGDTLDQGVRELYKHRRAVAACCFWTMCVWATGAIEVWIALAALGVPAGYAHAYVLESMSQGVRSALFLVPGALGVQEGGYLIIGGLLGISPTDCMALALIRRVRELAFGVPGVAAWQWMEGFQRWRRRTPPEPSPALRKPS